MSTMILAYGFWLLGMLTVVAILFGEQVRQEPRTVLPELW